MEVGRKNLTSFFACWERYARRIVQRIVNDTVIVIVIVIVIVNFIFNIKADLFLYVITP